MNLENQIENDVLRLLQSANIKSLLVAVSGGADSVALLCICHRLSLIHKLRVEAVNCNFHLRGAESNRDSDFTAALCHRLNVKLHSIDYDVADFMHANPDISTEMACRQLRYNDFHRIAEQEGLCRIAVAHNADDDIETMLLNMLRGCGSRGLSGMDTDNGIIFRPLLNTSRTDIEGYLDSIGQDYITDSSNLTSDYRRNFIRRDILPLILQRWPGARKALRRTIQIMKDESRIVENFYDNQIRKYSGSENLFNIYANDIYPGSLLRFLEKFGGNATITNEILTARNKSFAKRKWILDDNYEAILERNYLIIINNRQLFTSPQLKLQWEKIEMSAEIMNKVKCCSDHNTIYLPNGSDFYSLRKPKIGDRMKPLGMKGSRLISDIISDAKLDQISKSLIMLLCRKNDDKIIWVPGLKRSGLDLISKSDKIIYKVSILLNLENDL